LSPPNHEVDIEKLPHPVYGDTLPEETLPSPLHNQEISTTEYVGERETLLTFVFTRCPGPCLALTSSLAQVQLTAAENGYEDEVALMPITFDPDHDTPDRIRSFAEENGADPDANNWQFLRPESPDEADEVINGTFGIGFEEVPAEEGNHENHGNGNESSGHGSHGNESSEHGSHGNESTQSQHNETASDHEDAPETTFVHSKVLLLVNRDGYVERSYNREPPRQDLVLEDLQKVRDEFA
jgi:protein SCO1/2